MCVGNEDVIDLRAKRHETIKLVWNKLHINKNIFALSPLLVDAVIEHYIKDLTILKYRYKIDDKAQLHKVAGLMTAALLKYRPVLPYTMKYAIPQQVYANEIFAIHHGMSICGGLYDDNYIRQIMQKPEVVELLKSLLFLLHYRNYTSESLSGFFESLSIHHFPKNFEPSQKNHIGD